MTRSSFAIRWAGPVILAVAFLSACSGARDSGSHPATTSTTTVSTLAALASGTPLTATRGAGLETGTLNSGAMTVDTATTNATVTVYSATSIGLTAPNIPANGSTDSVTFSNFTTNTDATAPGGSTASTGTSTLGVGVRMTRSGASQGLQYSDYGYWSLTSGAINPTPIGYYAVGVATPTSQMPTTGTATFGGNAQGYGTTVVTGTPAVTTNEPFTGLASFTANFASLTMDGSITNIKTANTANTTILGTMNDITMTGTISGNTFSGTTAAGTNTGTGLNITGATGRFGGGFFGPSAKEAAGTFNLTTATGGTGSVNVIGSFGVHQ